VPFVTVFWKGDRELDTLCKSDGELARHQHWSLLR
jgi:hypothetical protein